MGGDGKEDAAPVAEAGTNKSRSTAALNGGACGASAAATASPMSLPLPAEDSCTSQAILAEERTHFQVQGPTLLCFGPSPGLPSRWGACASSSFSLMHAGETC